MKHVLKLISIAQQMQIALFIVIPIQIVLVMVLLSSYPILMRLMMIPFCGYHASPKTATSSHIPAKMSMITIRAQGGHPIRR